MQQRFGNIGSARRHQDGVERRIIAPTFRAIRMTNVHIVVTRIRQIGGRSLGELADALNGEHLTSNLGEDSRGVAGAGTDLQNLLAATQCECLHHEGHDIGLRDRLTGANR